MSRTKISRLSRPGGATLTISRPTIGSRTSAAWRSRCRTTLTSEPSRTPHEASVRRPLPGVDRSCRGHEIAGPSASRSADWSRRPPRCGSSPPPPIRLAWVGRWSRNFRTVREVRLNTDTALKVRFDKGVRRVELSRGQAFFEVAHDHAHPFIVVAGDTEVRAIGTRFDVRRDDGGAKVVLTEGKIAVTEHGEHRAAWTLEPGQALTTGRSKGVPSPVRADVAVATGWTEGRVSFRATPLDEAVEEINRYSRDKIILGADVPPGTRVNGDFAIDKPAEFVTAMTTLYGLKVERRLGGDIELRGPAA
ncbi:FecR domain-containing protein [Caulobacter segnis]